MIKRLALLLFCFIVITPVLIAQVLPKEGSVLTYRLIGFSFPSDHRVNKYKIEIATGNHNTESSFKKNIIKTLDIKTNKIILEVPRFGSQYTWRTIYTGGDVKAEYSDLHHFSTGIIPCVDTNNTRLRVVKSAEKYKDAYVFLDGSRALYDMNGNPVWYLPDIDSAMNKGSTVRDLKHTPQGTITFLLGNQAPFAAYEIDYNGDILWKGSGNSKVNGDTTENYHHEFTRLANGHYMVLGEEWADVLLKVTSKKDSSLLIGTIGIPLSDSVIKISRSPFGTLIEYDEKGNVVWSYKSSGYFNGSDLINHRNPDGSINVNVHDNAFFFDEKNKAIYISFKDINRIIKVKYPEGVVMNTYGEIFKAGVKENGNGLFCGQHCCRRSEDGYLYLFNNNSCHYGNSLPSLLIMQEPLSSNGKLKKVWEYQCTNEGLSINECNYLASLSGGSIYELPDHSLFACMGTLYSKVFIVDRDKKILWNAIPEIWDEHAHRWNLFRQYRADIITGHAQLDRMIWNNGTE